MQEGQPLLQYKRGGGGGANGLWEKIVNSHFPWFLIITNGVACLFFISFYLIIGLFFFNCNFCY